MRSCDRWHIEHCSLSITIQSKMGDKTEPCLTPLWTVNSQMFSLSRTARLGFVPQNMILPAFPWISKLWRWWCSTINTGMESHIYENLLKLRSQKDCRFRWMGISLLFYVRQRPMQNCPLKALGINRNNCDATIITFSFEYRGVETASSLMIELKSSLACQGC